ncbi:hypothetical protein G6M39_18140, partial [Agrobacterium tumefaciens]|nr:hypothetical protein [Agrobacterium tumefaciens]NTC60111.1 hypothetical protein [Agrobacterium tumefaciens]NTC68507.1 hypothetical protein [Agrobacterium tumefaciens]NTC79656.1 hypothetical protein [Agrobacterium tumefaciens]NTD00463.1 hypothetical protein [Agrobacterium tumefaciens]
MKRKFYTLATIGILGAMTASERAAGRYLRDGNGHPTPEQLASQVKA